MKRNNIKRFVAGIIASTMIFGANFSKQQKTTRNNIKQQKTTTEKLYTGFRNWKGG